MSVRSHSPPSDDGYANDRRHRGDGGPLADTAGPAADTAPRRRPHHPPDIPAGAARTRSPLAAETAGARRAALSKGQTVKQTTLPEGNAAAAPDEQQDASQPTTNVDTATPPTRLYADPNLADALAEQLAQPLDPDADELDAPTAVPFNLRWIGTGRHE
jgi:hypothetical protein